MLSHSQTDTKMGPGSQLCQTHKCIKAITTWAQEHLVKHSLFAKVCVPFFTYVLHSIQTFMELGL